MSTVQPQSQSGAAEPPLCANCTTALLGDYCHRCGQQRVDDPLSLSTLAGDVVSNITDIDHSKMWRTVWALITRPGFLTNEYLAGRRVAWITPLKLYLAVFALSFFLYSAFKSVALYDVATLLATDHTGRLARVVAAIAAKHHLTTEAFIGEVNSRWHGYMSFAQFVYPLLLAVVLKLFYFHQRFVEHLVFSMHYQALALAIVIIAWPLYRLTGLSLTQTSAILAGTVTLALVAYLLLAVRNVYRQSWPLSIAKGAALYVGYYLIYTGTTYSMLALAIVATVRAH